MILSTVRRERKKAISSVRGVCAEMTLDLKLLVMTLHHDTVQETRKKGLNSWELSRRMYIFSDFQGH